jgi:hypothetical protein
VSGTLPSAGRRWSGCAAQDGYAGGQGGGFEGIEGGGGLQGADVGTRQDKAGEFGKGGTGGIVAAADEDAEFGHRGLLGNMDDNSAPASVPCSQGFFVLTLGLRYAQAKGHPCKALAKRLLRHEAALFQFVLIPGLSADNNLAERRLRPLAVTRKISGGTRSPEGSATRMALTSLFATWQARSCNPFTACLAFLTSLFIQAQPAPDFP